MLKLKPQTILKAMRFWPPFLFCGIKVTAFDLDAGWVESRLRTRFWNTNVFGTHFGGSLFAMCDPFYVFLVAHHLGPKYYVWDYSGAIRFVAATRQTVSARFSVSEEDIQAIKQAAASGEKVTPSFQAQIVDAEGKLIAEIEKTVYVRLKPRYRDYSASA